ncbi:MAG: glycoside hydrolase family 3 C-terminal domain-containing protein [Sedimentisphaerales bacterium]|nr:glycoside hydrolase family 3 C-terminal domain-containing protein [Sedimentisphaerales bacterium]
MKRIRELPFITRVMQSLGNDMNFSMSQRRLALMLVFCSAVVSQAQQPIYLDSSKSIRERIDDLLPRMTLEEKIGQMNMPCSYLSALGRSHEEKIEFAKKFTQGTLREDLGPGGGFFTLANHVLTEGAKQQATFFNALQEIATQKTRLKIPLLQTEEGTHGLMCADGTIFPEGLAIGSTWNLDLIETMYEIAAREGRAVGIHQLFTLVIEPVRDPRLGRNQEAYSEDPYLVSCIAGAIVKAVQGSDLSAPDKCVAGFCHYPGQSQPVSGLERGAMEISEWTLRSVFLPSWETAIKKGGALGVMATYPAIDGIATHGSSYLLTDILRHEFGFEGLVLCEGGGLSTLVYEGVAKDQKDAGILTLTAGVDVGISYEDAYLKPLAQSVREGLVSEDLVNRAVRRILRQKFRLGLFEEPFVNVRRAQEIVHRTEHQETAYQAAREGIVLLKNENQLLPLSKDIKSIAVIGPNADHEKNLLGDYTSINVTQDIVTILEGIRSKVRSDTNVHYVKGCDVVGEDLNEIEQASRVAGDSDVAVVVVGENEWRTSGKKGTVGEGYDAATLELTGMQQELVKAVCKTGTPTVVVLVNGRPLATRWIAEHVPAIVEAWCPGEKGGAAVADVLFGDYNPSGRLSITIPRHVGQLPVYYNYPPSKKHWLENAWGRPYVDMEPTPLYAFGHGLSYTTFQYSDLDISPGKTGLGGKVLVRVTIKNSGERAGADVVQLYINDPISSVSTPVKELKGFRKVWLKPGESTRVQFELGPDHLALVNRHLENVVEPGEFQVMIGHSSDNIVLQGTFHIADRS